MKTRNENNNNSELACGIYPVQIYISLIYAHFFFLKWVVVLLLSFFALQWVYI